MKITFIKVFFCKDIEIKFIIFNEKVEKKGLTGIEPMTSGTAIQYSTIELRPLDNNIFINIYIKYFLKTFYY